jgi:hypothetical protein
MHAPDLFPTMQYQSCNLSSGIVKRVITGT